MSLLPYQYQYQCQYSSLLKKKNASTVNKRLGAESNRHHKICNLIHYHYDTRVFCLRVNFRPVRTEAALGSGTKHKSNQKKHNRAGTGLCVSPGSTPGCLRNQFKIKNHIFFASQAQSPAQHCLATWGWSSRFHADLDSLLAGDCASQ